MDEGVLAPHVLRSHLCIRREQLRTADPSRSWDQPFGWLQDVLWQSESALWGRWSYWLRAWSTITPPADPIPQIDLLDAASPAALGMLTSCVDFIQSRGYSYYSAVEYLMRWVLHGFGAEPWEEQYGLRSADVDNGLYQIFCLDLLLAHPHDYWGQLLSETGHGRRNGFFPTPLSICKMMASMVCDHSDHHRSASDPCTGTGCMLMVLSNHVLHLHGQDVDYMVLLAAKINMWLYAPWGACPLPEPDVEAPAFRDPNPTIPDPSCGSQPLPSGCLRGVISDARTSMRAHGLPGANLHLGSALSNPPTRGGNLLTHDYILANPPFSDKNWAQGWDPSSDPHRRFLWGDPPARQGDYAYLLHIIRSLADTGASACILPCGVLFRGNAEAVIRRKLVESGLLKGVVGLPENLFLGTGIPVCILLLDRKGADSRDRVLMLDASLGFEKGSPKNRLRERDRHRIVRAIADVSESHGYARLVSNEDILGDVNCGLNLSRHTGSQTMSWDAHDVDAHVGGTIPARDVEGLEGYWEVFPGLCGDLFERVGFHFRLRTPPEDVRNVVLGHPDLASHLSRFSSAFCRWRQTVEPRLRSLSHTSRPEELVSLLSESLLSFFAGIPLIDPYDAYQHFMNYWQESMQRDVHLVIADGWLKASRPREIVRGRDKNGKMAWVEAHDYVRAAKRFKSDLLPASLLVDRFFAAERDALAALGDRLSAVEQQLCEMVEEHGGESGFLSEVVDDRRRVTRAAVSSRIRKLDPRELEERSQLIACLDLLDKHDAVKAEMKAAEGALHAMVDDRYSGLSEEDVLDMVADKWFAHLEREFRGLVVGVGNQLAHRVERSAMRYRSPLPDVLAAEERSCGSALKHVAAVIGGEDRGWDSHPLGSFAAFQAGVHLPQASYRPGRFRVHGAGSVMGTHHAASHQPPLTVVGRVGTVGKPRFEPDGCWINNNAGALVADTSLCHPEYLQLLLEHVDWLPLTAVTTQPFLRIGDLLLQEFPLPPLEEQLRILEVTQAMRAAVAAMEDKLAKFRDVEMGLKQALLGGRSVSH